MVQLRSVKNLKVQEDQDEEPTALSSAEEQVQEPGQDEKNCQKVLESEKEEELKKPVLTVSIPLTTCSSPIETAMEFPPSPLRERLVMLHREKALLVSPGRQTVPEGMEKGITSNGQSDDYVSESPPQHDELAGESSVQLDDKPTPLESPSPSVASPVTPRKQKPPVSPNKPKLSLIVPPIPATPVSSALSLEEESAQVLISDSPIPSSPDVPPLFEVAGGQCFTLHQEEGEDTDSGSSTPMLATQRRDSLSSELSSEGLPPGMHLQDLLIQEQDLGLSDERNTSDEDTSSIAGSSSSREEELSE